MKRLKNGMTGETRHGLLKNQTCRELLVGETVSLILGILVILIFVPWNMMISCQTGYVLGCGMAYFMILHMTYAMEQAMCMNEKGAYTHVRKTTAIRMTIIYAIFIAIGILKLCNIVAALIGILTLKVAAYSQPITHKVLVKNTRKGG